MACVSETPLAVHWQELVPALALPPVIASLTAPLPAVDLRQCAADGVAAAEEAEHGAASDALVPWGIAVKPTVLAIEVAFAVAAAAANVIVVVAAAVGTPDFSSSPRSPY